MRGAFVRIIFRIKLRIAYFFYPVILIAMYKPNIQQLGVFIDSRLTDRVIFVGHLLFNCIGS